VEHKEGMFEQSYNSMSHSLQSSHFRTHFSGGDFLGQRHWRPGIPKKWVVWH